MAEATLPLGVWGDDDINHTFSGHFSRWNKSALADVTAASPADWVTDVGLLGSPKVRDTVSDLSGSLQFFRK
jgi:hypothetical protein